MSVRIRPGDREPEPEFAPELDDLDLDRVPGQDHIRAVFAAEETPEEAGGIPFPRPTRRRMSFATTRPRWSQIASIAVLGAVAVLVFGGLAYRLSLPSQAPAEPSLAVPVPAPTAAARPSPTPTPSVTDSDDAMTAVSWQGAALPVSPVAGPRVFTDTRAYGFAHDPLGAALAAVHISTHLDPYTGPKVFGPVLDEQVVAAPDDLVARTRAAYEAAARAQGYDAADIRAGTPVLAPTGAIRSWRIEDYRPDRPDRATVQLLVTTPQGQRVVYAIPVRWTAGDWAVSLANARPDATFDVMSPDRAELRDFHPFTTRGN